MPAQKKLLLFCIFLLAAAFHPAAAKAGVAQAGPVRLAVAGISHGHNSWLLSRKDDDLIHLVGIYESNRQLAEQMAQKYNLDKSLFFTDLSTMLEKVKPDGVLGFGPTNSHLSVVEACAPKGIPVMVEKPLATTAADANKMLALSKKYNTLVLTNFETSWYPVTEKAYQLAADTSFMGTIRKVVVHDGHMGPKEIGVQPWFFEWLTDPVKNGGGGALMDFGCYGANLMTYLMKGQIPQTVTCVTQQLKPAIYPKVDDEATIILTYPTAQCIIQASWSWPYHRKDMEVYGEAGYAISSTNKDMRIKGRNSPEQVLVVKPEETHTYTDPFLYFADVIRKKITVPPYGLYSLETNLIVAKILEAAKESAKSGRTVNLKKS
ncbi:Gfo/Idh/MocA family protein [Flavihumibacter profundi]|uniref:Gfo/Idh/MocA family protein n=1 Tax=Flavihumibacter profundi TaxID=2716883 RepID=UPI001CC41425|nr:Gfo/Idh/MocA family oxidoreductase [Flavihumibacter profundi]MBZ5856905.1 Gfo/Idh/MocA family oxidoreductase [Flavihumibacter profundi]